MGCSFDEMNAIKFLASRSKMRVNFLFAWSFWTNSTVGWDIYISVTLFSNSDREETKESMTSYMVGGARGGCEQCTPSFYWLVRPGCAHDFWTFSWYSQENNLCSDHLPCVVALLHDLILVWYTLGPVDHGNKRPDMPPRSIADNYRLFFKIRVQGGVILIEWILVMTYMMTALNC